MTRVNLVPVMELSDQHLVAEYREIFMVGSSLQRSIRSPNWEETKANLPERFTLNAGHVKFFYDKGKYLDDRYTDLRVEMMMRGMKPDPSRVFKSWQFPKDLYKSYVPTVAALAIIRERITERINLKPDWYRYTDVNEKLDLLVPLPSPHKELKQAPTAPSAPLPLRVDWSQMDLLAAPKFPFGTFQPPGPTPTQPPPAAA